MPGYGILPATEGGGLLPWSWALTRLRDSHDYWLSTVWPDGRPHTMPVWAVWHEDALWFSSARYSRKIKNLVVAPAVSMATEDPRNPVVLEGTAAVVTDPADLTRFLGALNEKYATSYGTDFVDPAVNASVRIRPQRAFGQADGDFTGSQTRWEFDRPGRADSR